MMRRAVLTATGLAMAATLVWTAGAASAAQLRSNTSPVTFTGTFNGVLSGSLSFSPPLTNTQPQETIVTTAAKTTKVSGDLSEHGSQIVGATLTGDGGGGIPGLSCSTIFTAPYGIPLGELGVSYATKSGSRPANSTVLYFSTFVVSGSSVLSTRQKSLVRASGSFQLSSTSQKQYPVLKLVFDQSLSTLQSECAGAGVSQLSFTGAEGKSSLKIG